MLKASNNWPQFLVSGETYSLLHEVLAKDTNPLMYDSMHCGLPNIVLVAQFFVGVLPV